MCVVPTELRLQPTVRGDVVNSLLLFCLLSVPSSHHISPLLINWSQMLWNVETNTHLRTTHTHTLTVFTSAHRNKHVVIVNQKVYFNTHYLVTQAEKRILA